MVSKLDTRTWLSQRFSLNLINYLKNNSVTSILVLGGGVNEPELEMFNEKGIDIYFFGIEKTVGMSNFTYLNLDEVNSNNQRFDLVICNQVIEHLFKLQNAFATIDSLVANGGLLWLTAPANNFRHGSPNYYSAGYSKEFFEKNLQNYNFEILDIGELSSERVYLYRHLLRVWPNYFQIKYPIISYFGFSGSYLSKLLFNIKKIPARILIALASGRWQIDGNFPVETFGLFKKSEINL
jgi:SAM-dependent methyltransferase